MRLFQKLCETLKTGDAVTKRDPRGDNFSNRRPAPRFTRNFAGLSSKKKVKKKLTRSIKINGSTTILLVCLVSESAASPFRSGFFIALVKLSQKSTKEAKKIGRNCHHPVKAHCLRVWLLLYRATATSLKDLKKEKGKFPCGKNRVQG